MPENSAQCEVMYVRTNTCHRTPLGNAMGRAPMHGVHLSASAFLAANYAISRLRVAWALSTLAASYRSLLQFS